MSRDFMRPRETTKTLTTLPTQRRRKCVSDSGCSLERRLASQTRASGPLRPLVERSLNSDWSAWNNFPK